MSETAPVLQDPPKAKAPDSKGLQLMGVQRAKSWRGRRVNQIGSDDLMSVRYRDLEALVRPADYEMPDLDQPQLLAHQRAIELAMRRGTILPAPFGVIFNGRRPVIRMLQDQYLVLDEAIAFLEGQCEVRVHIETADGREPDDQLTGIATQVYSELRRMARAAIPFAAEGKRVFSSAFLVEKTGWVEFIQKAEDAIDLHSELSIDVTGPWPPYDFVRFVL